MLRPISTERFHDRRLVGADRSLQKNQQLRRNTGPAFSQDQVIDILNAQARRAAHQVEGIKQFLKVEKSNLPGIFLFAESGPERIRSATMSAAGMMVNDSQFAQQSPDLQRVERPFQLSMRTPTSRPQFKIELSDQHPGIL